MDTIVDTKKLIATATKNIRDTVSLALVHDASHRALVVFDTESGLTQILTAAYQNVLPDATFMDYNQSTKEEIIATFDALSPRDLVVLIQTSDFRLNAFRIRIQLFQRKLKVIDHLHLYRNTPDSWETYIDSLAYDPQWFRTTGHWLKKTLDTTKTLRVLSSDTELIVQGGLEEAKLNIGDYTGMENIGGTFPIGEVFTEAKCFEHMNGALKVYALADTDFHTALFEPFVVTIERGLVTGWSHNTPQPFVDIITQIKTNERALVREIGFGLNRAITREKYLRDIAAFERILGLHFSLGEKHTVYKKQGITPDKTRYHVDIFTEVTHVYADDMLIYENGNFVH